MDTALMLAELRITVNNKSLTMEDVIEWKEGELDPEKGEVIVKLPFSRVSVALSGSRDRRHLL